MAIWNPDTMKWDEGKVIDRTPKKEEPVKEAKKPESKKEEKK